jgi:hypothetical protein
MTDENHPHLTPSPTMPTHELDRLKRRLRNLEVFAITIANATRDQLPPGNARDYVNRKAELFKDVCVQLGGEFDDFNGRIHAGVDGKCKPN